MKANAVNYMFWNIEETYVIQIETCYTKTAASTNIMTDLDILFLFKYSTALCTHSLIKINIVPEALNCPEQVDLRS